MSHEYGYEVEKKENVEMISFTDRFLDYDDNLKQEMPYIEFKEALNKLDYTVKQDKNGLFYKYLRGDKSTIEYEEEVDAYIDCYEHALNNSKKVFQEKKDSL